MKKSPAKLAARIELYANEEIQDSGLSGIVAQRPDSETAVRLQIKRSGVPNDYWEAIGPIVRVREDGQIDITDNVGNVLAADLPGPDVAAEELTALGIPAP